MACGRARLICHVRRTTRGSCELERFGETNSQWHKSSIYGIGTHLDPIKTILSDVIHSCVVDALQFPADKRAHRFFPLDASDFFYPTGRTERYTIIEISMFEGRSIEAKKHVIRLLFERIHAEFGISSQDVEVTITETPKHNWGFRGLPGDEIGLNYKVDV